MVVSARTMTIKMMMMIYDNKIVSPIILNVLRIYLRDRIIHSFAHLPTKSHPKSKLVKS